MFEKMYLLDDPNTQNKEDDEVKEVAQALALYEKHLEDLNN
ncbi:MAG: hypothetical protein RBS24_04680 [Bacilli bacterium]|nr:hypothetical protein [Bacilli bacterium]